MIEVGPKPATSGLHLPRPHELHVWRVNPSTQPYEEYRATLSLEERQRADRFVFHEDRVRFTVTRALLRIILGQYLEVSPSSLHLSYSRLGKPSLPPELNVYGITFNVTHSGDCSLLAFGVGIEVGIDVEHFRIERNIDEVAIAVLPPSRYLEFQKLPETHRKNELLRQWTRREAVGKAQGTGVRLLDSDVSGWFVEDIDIGDDYVAAIAAQHPIAEIRLREWKP